MNDLKDNIKKELEILENMISLNKEKEEIEKQRKKLDRLLEEYLKNLDWHKNKVFNRFVHFFLFWNDLTRLQYLMEIKYTHIRKYFIYRCDKIW